MKGCGRINNKNKRRINENLFYNLPPQHKSLNNYILQ